LPARLTAVLAALVALAACSSSASATFSLTGATVDPTYWCPAGSSNAPYTLHATIKARNDTAKEVVVDSATAELVLKEVKGSWLESVGDHYDAGKVEVSPMTIAPRSSAALQVTIPSSCTSGRYDAGGASWGDYDVKVHLVTSAGDFSITAGNRHEIRAA
jgi:hypothetical protein